MVRATRPSGPESPGMIKHTRFLRHWTRSGFSSVWQHHRGEFHKTSPLEERQVMFTKQDIMHHVLQLPARFGYLRGIIRTEEGVLGSSKQQKAPQLTLFLLSVRVRTCLVPCCDIYVSKSVSQQRFTGLVWFIAATVPRTFLPLSHAQPQSLG